MNDSPDRPGLHGKLPSHGDFITRRLTRGFVENWDEWLQRSIAASKAALGEGWLDIYLTSPIWSFVLQAQICGARAWAGILMPSVDRVGRYFPLTLAAQLPEYAAPGTVAVAASAWFNQARNLALSSLEQEHFSLDDFDTAVAGLGTPADLAAVDRGVPVLASWAARQGVRLPLDTDCGPQASLLSLMHGLIAARIGAYSVWWSEGSGHVPASLLISPGLPVPDAFTAMLSGQFQTDHWVLGSASPDKGMPA